MKHTLQLFLSIIILFSGINSVAENKTNENLACPTATINYSSTMYCSSVSNPQTVTLTGTDAYLGGTFSSTPVGLDINPATGAFIPSSSTSGSYTITYTIAAGSGCPGFTTTTNVTIMEQPNAGTDGTFYICDSYTLPIDLFSIISGEESGGVWVQTSGSGGNFNAVAGTFTITPGTSTTLTFDYIVTASAPCSNDTSVATITIGAELNAGTDGSITICESNPFPTNLFDLITGEQSGGTWVRVSGTGGTFNAGAGTFIPAMGCTTSAFEYTIASMGTCNGDSSVATVFINPQPIAGFNGETWVSENSATTVNLFDLITGEQPGGTWTQTSGTGGTFNAASGTFTPGIGCTTSTFMYNLVGVAPCINDVSMATVHIDAVPVGIPSTNNQTITNGNFSNIILSSSNVPSSNFTWTFVANNISGATNGSGTTISQQLSLIDVNVDGYVDYTITPINNTATGNSFAARVSIQSILNSETFTANNIKLSPNPVTDILNIENQYQINSIKIYNQLGQMIFGKEINNNTTQLDLSVINSGIYNVLIETEKGAFNHKIVKK